MYNSVCHCVNMSYVHVRVDREAIQKLEAQVRTVRTTCGEKVRPQSVNTTHKL